VREPTSRSYHGGIRILLAVATALGANAACAATVWAQAGWYVTPSLSLSESYDDNIFSAQEHISKTAVSPAVPTEPNPQATPIAVNAPRSKDDDFIFTATPGLEAGYQSEPFTLLAGYKFGAEVYAKRSELNSAPARQQLSLQGSYLPDPLLTLSLGGGYFESKYARELNTTAVSVQTGLPVTGLERGRARAETYFARPTASYSIDPVTTLTGGYGFAHSHEVGTPSSDTHEALLTLARKLGEIDTVELNYSYRHFSFGETQLAVATPAPEATPPPSPTPAPVTTIPSSDEDSHAVTVGWAHQLTELTRFMLRAGPRFKQGGAVDPEIEASIGHIIERGEIDLSYVRTQATAVGLQGSFDTQTANLTVKYDVLQNLTTTTSLAYYHTSRESESADVYSANLGARYRLLEWLSLFGNYNFSYQNGVFAVAKDAPGSDSEIFHNIVMIGVEAQQPFRLY
jgi:TonB dependent receptor